MIEILKYEIILGFRKLDGINKKDFYKKYNKRLEDDKIIKDFINNGILFCDDKKVYINEEYIYVSNQILTNFV